MRPWRALVLAAGLCLGAGRAEPARPPRVLRFAAIAPEGSSWGRLLKRFAAEVDRKTGGSVRIKWYFGGIAGDELTALDRSARGQLDGVSGAIPCQRVAPTLRVMGVIGLLHSDEEASAVIKRLRPEVERDFRNTPFRLIALGAGFGHRVLFSRTPVHSLAELQHGRFWVYSNDEVERAQLAKMGVPLVPLDPTEIARAFDEGRIDGAVAIPEAAVAWGFTAKAKYYTDLKTSFVPACMIITSRTFDQMAREEQEALRQAGAEMIQRLEKAGHERDQTLLDQVFPKHGLVAAPMSPHFREQFFAAAQAAGETLGPRLVPAALIRQVAAFLAEPRER
jgi:TRAP-type C4-dicarboxylate transport system substrate-binding protein